MTTKRPPKRQLLKFERDTSRRHKLHKPDRVIVRELLFEKKKKVETKMEK